MKLEFSQHIFEKSSNIKFCENLFSVAAELFHADGRIDMTKLIVVFRNFVKVRKNKFSVNLVHLGIKYRRFAQRDLEIGYFI